MSSPSSPGVAVQTRGSSYLLCSLALVAGACHHHVTKRRSGACARVDLLFSHLRHQPNSAAGDVVFRPLPPRSPPDQIQLLRLGSHRVPIPVQDFKLSLEMETQGKSGAPTVVLTSDHLTVMIGPMSSTAITPIDNVFGFVGDKTPRGDQTLAEDIFGFLVPGDKTRLDSKAGEKRTLALFGKAPTTLDLIRMGYEEKLSGAKCDPADPNRAVRKGIVLTLKLVPSDERHRAAYKDVAGPGSVLEVYEKRDKWYADLRTTQGNWWVSWVSSSAAAHAEVRGLLPLLNDKAQSVCTNPLSSRCRVMNSGVIEIASAALNRHPHLALALLKHANTASVVSAKSQAVLTELAVSHDDPKVRAKCEAYQLNSAKYAARKPFRRKVFEETTEFDDNAKPDAELTVASCIDSYRQLDDPTKKLVDCMAAAKNAGEMQACVAARSFSAR